jgi:3-oxoacyl-[acyl-carrier-protein] synthase II
MSSNKTEVWVTGMGLVSSLGEGLETHWSQLSSGTPPRAAVDNEHQAPYCVHPIVEFDITGQIPKRSDQRQMGPWQQLGTYAAGLALDDAGISHNPDLLAATNMIVAAGGGERDIEVDSAILEAAEKADSPAAEINVLLNSELRPTLFLTQLSNLMAGNISIVHGVTNSSRTFMGEETAGVSAVETAVAQIEQGQGDVFLVGGAYIAERADMMLLMELGHTLWRGEHCPVWSRRESDGGMIMGSAGVFLVLESRKHAQARGVKPYARINQVVSGRCNRQLGAARKVADGLFQKVANELPAGLLPVLSGCCGLQPLLNEEFDFLQSLPAQGLEPSIRGVATVFGNTLEAQFPMNIALASLAVSNGAFFDPFDTAGVETAFSGPPDRVLVSTWGYWRGEALGLVDKPDVPLRGGDHS